MSNSIASRVSNASMLVYRRDVVVVVVVEVMPTAALGLAAVITEQQYWNPHVEEETSARMKAVKNVDVYNMLSTIMRCTECVLFSWEVV